MPRLTLSNDCISCPLRHERDFCYLPPGLRPGFNSLGTLTIYPSHVVLISEGQHPPGVYIPCSGRVKLSVVAKDGKTVIMKVADEREVLGLSAIVSGRPSPFEATTMESCQIKFIEREAFLNLMRSSSEVAMAAGKLLSREIAETFEDVHKLLLAKSSTEKLARLLLSWVSDCPQNRDLRVHSAFTHEEIAQMIGSSRETVTRLLCDMKKRELIRLEGSTLVIPNRLALQTLAS